MYGLSTEIGVTDAVRFTLLTACVFSIIQVCIGYLRNFLQLTRIPAFAPYAWFYSSHHAPLQCVFLILTYLQRNRDFAHAHLARHLVDEVIDVFAPDEQLRVYSKEGHYSPRSTTQPGCQTPSAWRLLIALRQKHDFPPEVDQLPFKPSTPSRYQPSSPVVSLAAEVASERPNFTAIPPSLNHWERGLSDTPLILPSHNPLASAYHSERGEEPHMDNVLDISSLIVCSSSLAQWTDEYVSNGSNGSDPEGGADEAVLAAFAASTMPSTFLSEDFGDMLDNWDSIDGTSKTATATDKRARTASSDDHRHESGQEGDHQSIEVFADFVDETMDERLWMD